MMPRPRPADDTTAVERRAADPLAACRSGECGHRHPGPAGLDVADPERRAERRVLDVLEELKSTIGCLPAGHSLRRQFEAGELHVPWRLRADALLFRGERDAAAWRRLAAAIGLPDSTA